MLPAHIPYSERHGWRHEEVPEVDFRTAFYPMVPESRQRCIGAVSRRSWLCTSPAQRAGSRAANISYIVSRATCCEDRARGSGFASRLSRYEAWIPYNVTAAATLVKRDLLNKKGKRFELQLPNSTSCSTRTPVSRLVVHRFYLLSAASRCSLRFPAKQTLIFQPWRAWQR